MIKKQKKTKQCYHNDICRWKRDRFSSEVKIIRGIVSIKILKKRFNEVIETNHQINMTSDHFVSSNNSFKSHLLSVPRCFQHCSSCANYGDSASVFNTRVM